MKENKDAKTIKKNKAVVFFLLENLAKGNLE